MPYGFREKEQIFLDISLLVCIQVIITLNSHEMQIDVPQDPLQLAFFQDGVQPWEGTRFQ